MDEEANGGALPEEAPIEAPKSRRLERALGVAATLVRHKDLLVQALELLRRAQAVTPKQEAELVAAYEGARGAARERIIDMVERLQVASLGKVVVSLQENPEALQEQGRMLAEEARTQGRLAAEEARAELQRFLAENRPTIDAVERVSLELADAGRELAKGLKGAGKEAAEHLIYRGREVLRSADVLEYEQAAFDWIAESAPRVERSLVRILSISGIVFILVAVLVATRNVAWVQTITFALLALLMLALGLYMLRAAVSLHRSAAEKRERLERLAQMTPTERRAFFKAKWEERRGASNASAEKTEPPAVSRPESTLSRRLRQP